MKKRKNKEKYLKIIYKKLGIKMKELKDPCKTAIEKEICLGCNKLELKNFICDKNCEIIKNIYGKQLEINE